MGLSIEITVGDSMGRQFSLDEYKKQKELKIGGSYAFDKVGKLIHTIEVNDDLTLIGFLGLDFAREQNTQKVTGVTPFEWVRTWRNPARHSWLADKDRALKRITAMMVGEIPSLPEFEEPENAVDVIFGYSAVGKLAATKTEEGTELRFESIALDLKYRPTEKRLTAVLSGEFGVGEIEGIAKAGVSKTIYFKARPDTMPLKKEQQEKLNAFRGAVSAVTGKMPDCSKTADHDHAVCKAGRELQKKTKDLDELREHTWRARLSLGHVPLLQMAGVFKVLFQLGVGLFK
jgi:hypothetical protein